MSADRWSPCPRCWYRLELQILAKSTEVRDTYGRVDVDAFDAMREDLANLEAKLETFDDAENTYTLREDYEFWGVAEGLLQWRYKASCGECGFVVKTNGEKGVPLDG